MGSTAKPRIKAPSVRWLDAIDRYIREHDVRGRDLPHAASDVLDSAADRKDLDDLIRRRLLTVVRYGDRDGAPSRRLCGSSWSVHLSERAIKAFWPERAQDRQAARARASTAPAATAP